MENTMLIEVTNNKAVGILHELEELQLIKVLQRNVNLAQPKLSDKYRGIISKAQGKELNEHIKQMRADWNTI